MNPALPARRRADDFDRLVEAAAHGTVAAGPVSSELAALADLAVSLQEVPAVAPRAAFSADLRERLMAAAATELTPADAETTARLTVRRHPAARRRNERRLTVGIAALAIVGATAGTALASQDALPGQTLYPVKRAIENVRAGFTVGDDAKGSTLLSDAGTRLKEVDKLSKSSASTQNDREISTTLTTFASQAKKASDLLLSNYQSHHDPASIDKLHDFTSSSIDQLTELEPVLPPSARNALTTAAQALLLIDSAARNLCPTCDGGITSLPTTLLDSVAKTLGSVGTALGATAPPTTAPKSEAPVLPSVPATLGPANVEPSSKPTTKPSPDDSTSKPDKAKPTVPTAPTTTPSTLIGGVVDGLTGTVDGLLGTVGGVLNGVGGLLGVTPPSSKP